MLLTPISFNRCGSLFKNRVANLSSPCIITSTVNYLPAFGGESGTLEPFAQVTLNLWSGSNGKVLNLDSCSGGNRKVLGIGIAHANAGFGNRYPNDEIVRIAGGNRH